MHAQPLQFILPVKNARFLDVLLFALHHFTVRAVC